MTSEQRCAFEHLRGLVEPYRFRVQADLDGFPIVPGRYGRIEWYCDGVACHACPLPGELALAVYSDRRRVFDRLGAIPGVRRHQTGDTEMRAVFPPSALVPVAQVIRARRRRALSPQRARQLGARTAYRATSRVSER